MQSEIEKALKTLKSGGIILYPTDTSWGIGCDATHAGAVDRIFELKKRPRDKAMICLVNDFRMLSHYVNQVPEMAYDILKYANKPTTVVYDDPIRVAENLVATDNSLAIRVVRDTFCGELIKRLKNPLVSTSANLSGAPTPAAFKDIDKVIVQGADYVVNWNRDKVNKRSSSIIKIKNDGTVKVIRS